VQSLNLGRFGWQLALLLLGARIRAPTFLKSLHQNHRDHRLPRQRGARQSFADQSRDRSEKAAQDRAIKPDSQILGTLLELNRRKLRTVRNALLIVLPPVFCAYDMTF
jgi:hypothetical protein